MEEQLPCIRNTNSNYLLLSSVDYRQWMHAASSVHYTNLWFTIFFPCNMEEPPAVKSAIYVMCSSQQWSSCWTTAQHMQAKHERLTFFEPIKIQDTGISEKNQHCFFRYLLGEQILLRPLSKFTTGCKHEKCSLNVQNEVGSASLNLTPDAPLEVRLWNNNKSGTNLKSK